MLRKNKIVLIFYLLVAFSVTNLFAQEVTRSEQLKKSALKQIEAKKYGEAIDLLNKYISSAPRDTDGYTLRGTSFEIMGQYQNAVLDLRRALKLDQNNTTARTALARTEAIWHKQLRKKIKGHEREIAIDPSNPFNYLEIGKSYRWLEEWQTAEDWYDQYLARDDNASPDEIIRYTIILTKTGHIKKGEIILKKWVEKYPGDWRLWSRYGYFSLWLAKYKQSKIAFENALGFKPFFKEAQDGLDIVTKKAYVTQNDPRAFEKEFPIDRYFRLLRKNPDDSEMRFKLVNDLVQANRIEEAYQQLEILGVDYSEEPKYIEKWDFVTAYRDSVYNVRIEELVIKVENNPTDKESVLKLVQYYSYLEEYDEATYVLEDYLELVPDENDPRINFEYAQILAWNRYFEDAGVVLDKLIIEYPQNLDYKLFRAQISIWTETEIELASEYVEEVLAKHPNNVDALVAKATLLIVDEDFEAAQETINKAKLLDPANNEVFTIQTRLEFQIIRVREREIYEILEKGRGVLGDEGCEEALPYYVEYLEKAEPNNIIKREYGDVLFCAKYYDEALVIYNEILDNGFDYRTSLERGKLYYEVGDSISAVNAFKELVEEDSTEFQPQLYLGDSYSKMGEYDSAMTTYENLLTWELDSMQVFLVEQRMSWIPATGLNAIIKAFPSSIGFSPQAQFYFDDLSFSFSKIGGRIDLGVFQYLTIGASFYRTTTTANWESLDSATVHYVDSVSQTGFTGRRIYTSFKGHIVIPFSDELVLSIALGIINTEGFDSQDETEISFSYDNYENFGASILYFASDANLILYSPYLIDYHLPNLTRMTASIFKVKGYYNHSTGLLFSTVFDYLAISDGNEGNNFQFRMGYQFTDPFSGGYEYFYQNFKYPNDYLGGLYYSPQGFDSHSLWADFLLEDKERTEISMGGKIGYAPQTDQLILEGHMNAEYRLLSNLFLQGSLTMGQSSQYNSAYRFFGANLSAYWTFW